VSSDRAAVGRRPRASSGAGAMAEWLRVAASVELGLGEAVEDKRHKDEEARPMHSVWGEEKETDKWIMAKAKPRIGHRFRSSIGEYLFTFFGSWRRRMGMGCSAGVSLRNRYHWSRLSFGVNAWRCLHCTIVGEGWVGNDGLSCCLSFGMLMIVVEESIYHDKGRKNR
jgi:hypothetical protein